eukprot:TRINITY_DN20468_c0_g1_i1.p1 TRINITY_DN20468_c0_g1~~TRINITY_DN20468_c0_g1_i1.p1  ORF type:complete len:417 (+),score=57.73 TRINITY_DN20468_c0_g1_i1:42-1292(+)
MAGRRSSVSPASSAGRRSSISPGSSPSRSGSKRKTASKEKTKTRTATSIQGLLNASNATKAQLSPGWIYFSMHMKQVHLLWIYDGHKLKATHKEKSATLRKWLQILGDAAEITVWLDSVSFEVMCKEYLFVAQGYTVKFKNIESLYDKFVSRSASVERSPEGFGSEAETKIFSARLYMKAAYAATTLRRQKKTSGVEVSAAERAQRALSAHAGVEIAEREEPIRMLIDLYKHLIVLECTGLYVDWDVEPFDLIDVLEKHNDTIEKSDCLLFSTMQGAPTKWLYYKRFDIKCVSNNLEDQMNFPENQEHITFVRKVDETRLVCPEKIEDPLLIDHFKLRTAHAIYKALRKVVALLGTVGDTDSYFDMYEQVKKGKLKGDEQLEREAALTNQILDTINWFSDIYKPQLDDVYTLDIAV